MPPRATPGRSRSASAEPGADRSSVGGEMKMLLGTGAVMLLLSLPTIATAAVRCGVKTNPPYGGAYDAVNLPSPPGTLHLYYSFLSSPAPVYARRPGAAGANPYETLRSHGG